MRPIWLIESNVYHDEVGRLLAEIRRQGMVADLVPFEVLQKQKSLLVAGRPLGEGDCGTFPFAFEIQLHRRWPGDWCGHVKRDSRALPRSFRSKKWRRVNGSDG